MSKKKLYIIAGGAVLLIIILIILSKTGVIGKNEEGVEVEMVNVKPSTIVETVSATGKIQPEIEVKIASLVSGEIITLNVVEGQLVKKGTLLVKINPDLYTSALNRVVSNLASSKSNLNQTEATFNEAKANFERNKDLYGKGIISKADWDKIVATFEIAKANKQSAFYNVQSANASVKEAEDNLARTAIYSPADGTISVLNVELGERVLGTQQMAGTELLRVANLENMEVEVDVNENDIVKIKVGDTAKVEVDAYLKKEFKGQVTSISNSADDKLTADEVTNFKVKVRILKESYLDLLEGKPVNYSPFRPGMTATVDIITQSKSNILVVPISSVVVKVDTASSKREELRKTSEQGGSAVINQDKKLECVFVKKGKKAQIKVVKTGIQDASNIEITKGLKKGDTVITGPYNVVSKDLSSGDIIKTPEKKD